MVYLSTIFPMQPRIDIARILQGACAASVRRPHGDRMVDV